MLFRIIEEEYMDLGWCQDKQKSQYEGMMISDLTHIQYLSYYNHNYYLGLNNDLIFAHRDDDCCTTYYIVTRDRKIAFAESSTASIEIMHVAKEEKLT